MATLKYRKSRKNKKQLKKKKRTYKKRKTTRRKKGGTVDYKNRGQILDISSDGRDILSGEVSKKLPNNTVILPNGTQILPNGTQILPNGDTITADGISIPNKNIKETIDDFKYTDLDEVYKIKLDDLKDEFMKSTDMVRQLYLLKNIVADGNKKSCGINYEKLPLFKLDNKNFVKCQRQKVDAYCTILKKVDEILKTKPHHDDNSEFKYYKGELENKIADHATEAGIKSTDITFMCGMVKPQP